MRLFITGTESFVGKELIRQCDENGIEITGIDLSKGSRLDCYSGDICSGEVVDLIPQDVDAIVHLAALSRDGDCKNNAYKCFNVNVLGTLKLIEAAKEKGAKQFIFASSEWVYDGFVNDEQKNEDSLVNIANHTSEYALSKLVSEANLRQQFQYGFCPVTVLRFGIIYGPREKNFSAVESLFFKTKESDEIVVGSARTARCFVHVSDIASGIISSIGLNGFHIINLQGSKLITLKNIIETSASIFEKRGCVRIIEKDPEHPSVRHVSNKKAIEIINWKSSIDLESGLRSLQ